MGLLESLSKLETRYINTVVRRRKTQQKKNFYINTLKYTGTI